MQDANEKIIIKESLFAKHFRNSPAYIQARNQYLIAQFRDLVSKEGEDNLNKARIFLNKYRQLAPDLIASPGTMSDASGRCFHKPLSAYGYLYWAGDSDMLAMLDGFTDRATEEKLYVECNRIETEGISFEFNGMSIIGSKHFDMEPVIKAAYDYETAANQLINQGKWGQRIWAPVKPLFSKLGVELGNVPLWIAQLFCSKKSLWPSPDMQNLQNDRTIVFFNLASGGQETWFINGKPNPKFGKICIQKIDGDRAWGLSIIPTISLQAGKSDKDALAAIHQIRMKQHPKQRLAKLREAVAETNSEMQITF